ncbi:MAG TPA: sugar phosphate isomerase/epimerase [Opitutus sp.]|nr:sugar phosphate isomerase/epimerase [Opitutus sp.]
MNRRTFISTLATAAAVTAIHPLRGASPAAAAAPNIKVGLDNFSVRAMQWKAPALIDYAASLKCDTLLISDLDAFESLEEPALRAVRRQAKSAGLDLFVGSWSICPTSKTFKNNWGTAEEHLRLTLRVAKALGSPVARVVLGNMEDRKSVGGIQARIKDTVTVLKACRRDADKAGVKVAIENHAGDLHSWELRQLIEDAGTDFVGANIDSGNAVWTLEDPMDVLETLGPVTLCSSLRDSMVWAVPEGASVQWTAVGEGLMDWQRWTTRWRQLCPNVPIIIETISGFARVFPYKTPEFWEHYDKRPEKLAKFEAFAKRGKPIPAFQNPSDADERMAAQQAFQKSEIEKSITYLRKEIGLGVKV